MDLSRLIWTPLKLVPPGTNFSEIFGPPIGQPHERKPVTTRTLVEFTVAYLEKGMTAFHEYASETPRSVRYFTYKIWNSGIRCGVSEVSGNYSGPSAHNVLHYQLHATLSFRVYCAKFETNAHFECLFRVYIISSPRDGPNFSEGVHILQ